MYNHNSTNELKLDKIMTAKLSDREKVQLLHSINETLERYILVICLAGGTHAEAEPDDWSIERFRQKQDILVNSKGANILIISGSEPEKLNARVSFVQQEIENHSEDYHLGISRTHEEYNIDKALEEAKAALEEAKATGKPALKYLPLSSYQLLISLKGCRELIEFYDAYVKKIRSNVSRDHLTEMLRTAELYILHNGNYKRTAQIVNQHENTVRYRINKIRSSLSLDNDPVAFHETLSLAVKIGLLL